MTGQRSNQLSYGPNALILLFIIASCILGRADIYSGLITARSEIVAVNKNNLSKLIGLGAILLVVWLLWGYFKSVNKVDREQTSSAKTEVSETSVPTGSQLPADYVVQKGDSLWDISMKAYGSGYNWVDVYAANRSMIKNPDMLLAGTKITLPKVETKEITYQVKKGDNLWNIAAVYCGTGFGYTKIATANHINSPDVIEPGQMLKIVCN